MEVLAERPRPEATDIIVRDWVRSERAVVLLVDVSGSMKGAKMLVTLATITALCQELGPREELGVLAFWKDAVRIRPIGTNRPVSDVIGDLRSIRARRDSPTSISRSRPVSSNSGARDRRGGSRSCSRTPSTTPVRIRGCWPAASTGST